MFAPRGLDRVGSGLGCLLVAAVFSGCGGINCFPVTGKVTLDGSPLPDAKVSFMPSDDQGLPTIGVTDASGIYSLRQTADMEGAPAGSYTVRIATYREGNVDADPPIPEVRERVPPHYNLRTTLKAEIAPKANAIDFDLRSKP
ncbi:MAG: carboxypeptidase regulatory-like domain-containing protein [Planctomycetaceae bacterium]|nr:carboxypeptidase regulatory-like domain-containing protein [Planctomycetaceae bacterium]